MVFAHTKPGCSQDEWQPLEQHLRGVAKRARVFAESFGTGEWGEAAGLWHDLGKYSKGFQEYLANAGAPDVHGSDLVAKTDHSTAGAQHAAQTIDIMGHLFSFAIAGHHAGLLDIIGSGACLDKRLKKCVEPWNGAPSEILNQPSEVLPGPLQDAIDRRDGFSVSFFVRMLFSCLVDADFLDTEEFMDPQRALSRMVWPGNILERMETALAKEIESFGTAQTTVNQARAAVQYACLNAAEQTPGLFSLTVPTGGGKTLASLAFALRHARRYGHERVIYVIPFTSIIEQNAEVFRKVFRDLSQEIGEDLVLEHHSNFDTDHETTQSRLATENWDAPLIVTTSVQFYDSLFANRTSRCRKLHNLARSVIVLDEVQTLPVDFLEPCLRVLKELTSAYGTSVVLCTATQPAVHKREDFSIGLDEVREIIPNPAHLYLNLKRVKVTRLGAQTDDEISEQLAEHPQVLCVVNTRRHAQLIFEKLCEGGGVYHLSAQMCPEHRTAVLDGIKKRLEDRRRCRVISTQLIEAGVDVDFPVVYRSIAGIDSIAQSAGRCNRNGTLPDGGRTFVFRSEHTRSERFFSDTAGAGAQVLELHQDPLSLEAVEQYFQLYYWSQENRWDKKQILREFSLNPVSKDLPFLFNFATVGRSFCLIEDTGRPVIIPWGAQGWELCEELRAERNTIPSRRLLRRLQRYTIQIPQRIWNINIDRTIENVHDRYPVLINPKLHYDDETGLNLEADSSTFLEV